MGVQSKHSGFQVWDSGTRGKRWGESRMKSLPSSGSFFFNSWFRTVCNFNGEFSLVTTTCRALRFCISQHITTDWDPPLIHGTASNHFLTFPGMLKTPIKQSVFKSKLFQKWGVGSLVLPLFFFLKQESDLSCNTCLNLELSFRNRERLRGWLLNHIFVCYKTRLMDGLSATAHPFCHFDWSVTDFLARSKQVWCLLSKVWEKVSENGAAAVWDPVTIKQMGFLFSYHWKMNSLWQREWPAVQNEGGIACN